MARSTFRIAAANASQLSIFVVELLSPCGGLAVERDAPPFRGHARFTRDESAVHHPVERRVQRSLIHREHVTRHLLNAFGNRPAVKRPSGERLENEQVEGALQQVDVGFGHERG